MIARFVFPFYEQNSWLIQTIIGNGLQETKMGGIWDLLYSLEETADR